MRHNSSAIGVDLGGTKIEAARVDGSGRVQRRCRRATPVGDGPGGVCAAIVDAVRELRTTGEQPVGVGVGVAGQVESSSGRVLFAPNLDWRDVPLRSQLRRALEMPVVVSNDVRAATFGEWRHGAGRTCDDLVCVFVGTGIGGGVVSGGRMLTGVTGIFGEVGHTTVQLDGPLCHCGNRGCLEALASGWAIARDARNAAGADARRAARLLEMAGGDAGEITARMVGEAAADGDALAAELVENANRALAAGMVWLVNALNPARLILGGGVVEGSSGLVARVEEEVSSRALDAATSSLEVVGAELHEDSGVVGAAALAISSDVGSDHPHEEEP
jgi:glucokinase